MSSSTAESRGFSGDRVWSSATCGLGVVGADGASAKAKRWAHTGTNLLDGSSQGVLFGGQELAGVTTEALLCGLAADIERVAHLGP
jgi:hypothetical protein